MKHIEKIVLTVSIFVSLIATLYTFQHGYILAYGDAESHINIAKRMVSSITPGFGQMGGNWLPLQHMAMLPFVGNDWLWRSGLGGSVSSMVSYVLSVILVFKLAKLISGDDRTGAIAAAIFGLNANILYMQSVPMGELLEILMFLGAAYFFTKWVMFRQFIYIIFSSFFVLGGSLIRYDAWFLLIFGFVGCIGMGLINRFKFSKIEGALVLFTTVAITGIIFWMVWNLLIFKNPIYFLESPYSAKSQQQEFLQRGQLLSYKNLHYSLAVYALTTEKNVGLVTIVIGSVGFLLIGMAGVHQFKKNKHLINSWSGLFLLFTPFIFYVVTLYLGISIIFVPELTPLDIRNTLFGSGGALFNVRYGIMMVPVFTICAALVIKYVPRPIQIVLILGLCAEIILGFLYEPVTLKDGKYGLSSRRPGAINEFIRSNYDYGYIMFDDFSRVANPVELGIPMNKIIYIGNHPYWDQALVNPSATIRWLAFRENETDSLWLQLKDNPDFKNNYQKIYNNEESAVYKRLPTESR